MSLLETIAEIETQHITIAHIVTIIDRQQGGVQNIKQKNYSVYCFTTIDEIIDIAQQQHIITPHQHSNIHNEIHKKDNTKSIPVVNKKISYEQKIKICLNATSRKMLDITINKKSNLIIAADKTLCKDILHIAHTCGKHIVALKIHVDIIEDFNNSFIQELKHIAQEKNFLLFEDRKFADIGNTQLLQLNKGIFKISEWADIITAQLISGEKGLLTLTQNNIGIVPILEMSSEGTLTDKHYIEQCYRIIQKHPQHICGIVAQQANIEAHFLKMTPGISLNQSTDNKGQQYISPQKAITEYLSDYVIVGRDIYDNTSPEKQAQKYQQEVWRIYQSSLSH